MEDHTPEQVPLAGPDIEEKHILGKELEFLLSEHEVADKGRIASAVADEIESLEKEFSQVKKEWAARIGEKEAELKSLLDVVGKGKETRIVDCVEKRNYSTFQVQFLVDGKVIEERAMTADERSPQMEIPAAQETKEPIPPGDAPEEVEVLKEQAVVDANL